MTDVWSSRRLRILVVCAALVGLVASLTLYDSLFVRAGALGALCPLRGEQKANMMSPVVEDGAS